MTLLSPVCSGTWNAIPRFCCENILELLVQGKGKAIPLQVWTGPEGSRRLRLPDFMTIGT